MKFFCLPLFGGLMALLFPKICLGQPAISVSVEGDGCRSGSCFNNLDPEEVYYYRPQVTLRSDIPTNGTTTYLWTITGGNCNGKDCNTQQNVAVLWRNTPNFPVDKKIKVRVTYTYRNARGEAQSPISAESAEREIQVKHIGAVGTISINGSGYSGTAILPCGVQQFSVSVPAVFTDPPQTVNYFWSYPAGWTGPSETSTPSVTVTSSPGSQGTLRVQAQRIDGTFRTSNQVNINRPLPQKPTLISGYSATLCAGEVITLSASAQNATSYTWIRSGGINLPNGQNEFQTGNSVNVSASSRGTVVVRANSDICQTSSVQSDAVHIYFGPANTNEVTVDSRPITGTTTVCSTSGYALDVLDSGGSSFNWSSSSTSTYLQPNYDGSNCLMIPNRVGGFVVSLTANNKCGSASRNLSFYANDCGGGRGFSMWPNPVKDDLTIEFLNDSDASYLPEKLLLLTEEKRVLQSADVRVMFEKKQLLNKKIKWDVRQIPRGTYYVHGIYDEQTVIKQRLVIEK